MKRIFHLRRYAWVLGGAAFMIMAAAWQTHSANDTHKKNDTVPERNKKIRNIDDALEELEKGKLELEKSFRSTDWEKMQKDLEASLKSMRIDQEKMKLELEQAMKNLDEAKIRRDVDSKLSALDLEKMKKELAENEWVSKDQMKKILSEVDAARSQARAAIPHLEMEKMKAELEKIKDINMDEMRKEMEKIRPDVERSLADARVSLDKAKGDLLAYRDFINDLDRDGLIKKDETYKIRYEDGELTINGKKQPESVTNKYKAFLEKHKEFTLKKDEDSFDINHQQ